MSTKEKKVRKPVVKKKKVTVKKMGFKFGNDGAWGKMAMLSTALTLGHGKVGIGRLGVSEKGPSAIGFYQLPKGKKIGDFCQAGQFISAIQFDDSKAIDVLIGQLISLKATYKNPGVFYNYFDEIALAS
jgi:hypothetical protein